MLKNKLLKFCNCKFHEDLPGRMYALKDPCGFTTGSARSGAGRPFWKAGSVCASSGAIHRHPPRREAAGLSRGVAEVAKLIRIGE